MAKKGGKEPLIVFIIFVVLLVAVIAGFFFKGNIQYFEELDPKQLYMISAILAVVYILYVELRGKGLGQVIVDEKTKTYSLVDSLPQGVVVLDDENNIITANDPACAQLSINSLDVVGKAVGEVFDAETAGRITGSGGKFDGKSVGGQGVKITVVALRGEAGRLVILEEMAAAAAPVAHTSPTSLASLRPKVPAVWKGLDALEPHYEGMNEDLRRQVGSLILRMRRGMNRPEELEAIPSKAEKGGGDVGKVVQDVVATTAPAAHTRDLKVEVNTTGECTAECDSELLARAIEEILVNAYVYSSGGGTIRIEVEGTESEISLRVTDSGVGIPNEEFSKLFDKGFTGSNQGPDGAGGAGLGLALARRVIESHGGSIWVESKTGQGTRLSLNIPRK